MPVLLMDTPCDGERCFRKAICKEGRVKRHFVIPILLVLCLAGSTVLAGEDASIPWGEPVSVLDGHEFSHNSGDIRFYRVNETCPCPVARLEKTEVTYGYRDNKLAVRLVEIRKARDFRKVLGVLTETYGIPSYKEEEGWENYRWETDDLKVKLKSQRISGRMKIGMYYKPLLP